MTVMASDRALETHASWAQVGKAAFLRDSVHGRARHDLNAVVHSTDSRGGGRNPFRGAPGTFDERVEAVLRDAEQALKYRRGGRRAARVGAELGRASR